MTTKRDLVEAHQFTRRRLVTAFVSGAPGGDMGPVRPGRALAAGVALAALVVAGGAATRLASNLGDHDPGQPGPPTSSPTPSR